MCCDSTFLMALFKSLGRANLIRAFDDAQGNGGASVILGGTRSAACGALACLLYPCLSGPSRQQRVESSRRSSESMPHSIASPQTRAHAMSKLVHRGNSGAEGSRGP